MDEKQIILQELVALVQKLDLVHKEKKYDAAAEIIEEITDLTKQLDLLDKDEDYSTAQMMAQKMISLAQELFLLPELDREIDDIPELSSWMQEHSHIEKKRMAFILALIKYSLEDLCINKEICNISNGLIDKDDDTIISKSDLRTRTNYLLSRLKPNKSNILKMRYGIGMKKHTTDEIAEQLSMDGLKLKKTESAALRQIAKLQALNRKA
jgi:hypothetical protein